MVICCVVGCINKPDKDSPLRFHHIPRIPTKHGEDSLILSTERRKKWFSAIKRSDISVNALHHIVCSVHFLSGKPAALFETSNVDWVPSLTMGYGDVEASTARVVSASNRAARRHSGKRKFESEHAAQASSSTTAAAEEGDTSAPPAPESVDFVVEREENTNESGDKTNDIDPGEKSVQTDMKCKDISLLQDEMKSITSELCNLRLEVRMNKVGTEDWFNSDEKVNFCTGLPNSYVLMTVFEFVLSEVKHSSLSALTQFQEFAMILMRLRLNLTISDLAYRFAISTSTTFINGLAEMIYLQQPLCPFANISRLKLSLL